MTPDEVKVYNPVISDITDVLHKHDVSSIDGERILMFLTGVSFATRVLNSTMTSEDCNKRIDELMQSMRNGIDDAIRDAVLQDLLARIGLKLNPEYRSKFKHRPAKPSPNLGNAGS